MKLENSSHLTVSVSFVQMELAFLWIEWTNQGNARLVPTLKQFVMEEPMWDLNQVIGERVTTLLYS